MPADSINGWIDRTKHRNPAWTHQPLAMIRGISPISIALFQIALITAILKFSQWASRRVDSPDPDLQ